MSFTSEIKKELIRVTENDCCVRFELAAIVRMNGVISTHNENVTLDVQTESPAIARRIYTLMKHLTTEPIELLVRKKMKLRKNNIYIVRVNNRAQELLEKIYIEIDEEGFEQGDFTRRLTKDCCKRAYLRGAFLARGSINNPETSSYHLEMFNVDQDHNHLLCQIVNEFDLKGRELKRRNGYIVYVKEAEKIAEFLRIIGAHNALFKFEDVRIVRDMRNSVNRIVNCETANLNKTISASLRQVESIKRIDEQIGLDSLPEKLAEIARTRIKYPEVTLKELGELLPSGKLSKSGVNHRLKKIEEIAKSLTIQDEASR